MSAAILLGLLVASACNGSGEPATLTPMRSGSAVASSDNETRQPDVTQAGETVYTARQAGTVSPDPLRQADFWVSAMPVGGAAEVEFYSDLKGMATAADAVIVGRLTGRVVTGPTVRDESEPIDAEFTLQAYEVEVMQVVRGSLPVGEKTILLSTLGSPEPYAAGPALMFLRWRGYGYEEGWAPKTTQEQEAWARSGYRLISSQGLFLDTPDGARNPISEAFHGGLEDDPQVPADPVAREANVMSFEELRTLIASYP